MKKLLRRTLILSLKFIIYSALQIRINILIIKHKLKKFFKEKNKIAYLKNKIEFKQTNKNYSFKEAKLYNSLVYWDTTSKITTGRINLLIVFFAVAFIALFSRLMIISSGSNRDSHKANEVKIANRFDIYDRNGNVLAVNIPSSSLYANPSKIIDPVSSIEKLKQVFPDINTKKVLADISNTKSFVWIRRDITPRQQEDIFNLGMPGFSFENEQKRIYTYGNLLSHVIGYVGRDDNGLAGIEKFFENRGNYLLSNIDNSNGIELSIDLKFQNILSEELDNAIKKFKAKGAAGIIVNPNNGEILAMVSKPDFDPHFPSLSNEDSLFNKATLGTYEMGSGMKAITLAVGLDTGIISMDDAYDLTYLKVNGFQVKDFHAKQGYSSIAEIFLKSSNVGVSQIMLEIGKSNLHNYLKKLGLLDKLKLEIPERARPIVQSSDKWSDLALVTMSYGYAISVTPAHFIQSIIPVVNGGTLYPLTLIKIREDKERTGKQIFKAKTSKNMLKMMRLAVKEGTGKKAEVKGYYIGGKTGTANKVVNGKYDKNKRISSFFGVMPATKPEYLIYVVLDEPVGIKETFGYAGGGWSAAPAVSKIFERIVAIKGMSPVDPGSKEVEELNNIIYKIDDEA